MSVQEFGTRPAEQQPERPMISAALRGLQGNCPSCGETRLFKKGLIVEDSCASCGEEMHHHRADDLPAYLNIFIIGHVVVAAAMILMDFELFGMWTVVILSSVLAIFLAVALLRPMKGMVVGIQWALRMHGFGGHDD
jgi:uncharacterized protein (DUF983 family)